MMKSIRTTLFAAVTAAALAAGAQTASAQTVSENFRGHDSHEQHDYRGNGNGNGQWGHGQDRYRDQVVQNFLNQESARRDVQDREREQRMQRQRNRFENERRELLRQYGVRSAEYRWFLTRSETRWDGAVARERRTMITQREAARRRFAQFGLDASRFDFLDLGSECIDRTLAQSGVVAFPYANDLRTYGYGNDHPSYPSNPSYPTYPGTNRPRVTFGVGVNVHN